MKKTVIGIIIGTLLVFILDVAAEIVISSSSVSYSNTTVNAALDDLFSSVDINDKIGTTDISTIGDGTLTGAIFNQQSQINQQVNSIKSFYTAVVDLDEAGATCFKIQADSYYAPVVVAGVNAITVLSVSQNSGTYRLHTTPSNASINTSNGEICVTTGSWYAHSLILSSRPILYTFTM